MFNAGKPGLKCWKRGQREKAWKWEKQQRKKRKEKFNGSEKEKKKRIDKMN